MVVVWWLYGGGMVVLKIRSPAWYTFREKLRRSLTRSPPVPPLPNCPGRKPFSMVERGLVIFCNSKQWTKQAAARGAGNRRFCLLRRKHPARSYKCPVQKTDLLWGKLRARHRPGRARAVAKPLPSG
jgi:hypothetical protein